MSESRGEDGSGIFVLLERDPEDLLEKVFDAEHELYTTHPDGKFDVRVTLRRLTPKPPRGSGTIVHLDRIGIASSADP